MSFRDPEYLRVGAEVAFGEVSVAYGDVAPLHEIVTQDFTYSAHTYMPDKFDFDRSSSACGVYFEPRDSGDDNLPQRYVNAVVSHESIPEGWRLTTKISTASYDNLAAMKQVFYRVETAEGDVVQAVKAVKFVFDKSEFFISDDGLTEETTSTRKMYERPMTADDCQKLRQTLESTAKRAAVTRRKPVR